MEEGRVAQLAEVSEMFTGGSSHSLYHFPRQLHGRRHGFRISAKDIAEVNVEEFPWTHTRQYALELFS